MCTCAPYVVIPDAAQLAQSIQQHPLMYSRRSHTNCLLGIATVHRGQQGSAAALWQGGSFPMPGEFDAPYPRGGP